MWGAGLWHEDYHGVWGGWLVARGSSWSVGWMTCGKRIIMECGVDDLWQEVYYRVWEQACSNIMEYGVDDLWQRFVREC